MPEPYKFETALEGKNGIIAKVAVLENNTEAIKKTVEKIFNILEGKNGLVSKVAVLEQEIKNQPSPNSLKFHASVGGGIVFIVGALIVIFARMFMR